MPPGGFLDGASLCRDCFLLCLSFFIYLTHRFAVAGIADPGPRAGTGISDTGKNRIRFLVKNEMPDRLILS